MGIPHDTFIRRFLYMVPSFFTKLAWMVLLNNRPTFRHLNTGNISDVTPGISSDCLQLIGDGVIEVVKPISKFDEKTITIGSGKDELRVSPDYIVLCTGYSSEYKFLQPGIINDNGDIPKVEPLYKHVFHVDNPSLVFLCLPARVETWVISELQARWVDRVFSGQVGLPSKDVMIKHSQAREAHMKKMGIQEKYWHVEDYVHYSHDLAKMIGAWLCPFRWENSKMFIPWVFKPITPVQFRVKGKGSVDNAWEKVARSFQKLE
jgi:hypothetical protein